MVCPNTPPEARCKDVTLYLDSNGRAVLNPPQANNGSSDPDGDPVTYSLSETNFSCSDIGTQHAVTLTVTDDGGLSDSCIAKVDNLAPVPNAASLPQVTGQCSATIAAAPTATDNCAGTLTGTTGDPLSYSTQGTYTVNWTFDDGKGNTATQTQQVVVQDTVAPTVITKNITVPLNANGNASISVDDIDNGSTDNCCLGSKSISKSSFTCADVGQNTVTLTVTDCNGNSSSETAIVTVKDVTPPELIVPDDMTVEMQTAVGAEVSLTPDASDTCDTDVEITSDEPKVFPLGSTIVTFTATDDSGNSTSESMTVTVQGLTEIKENAKSCLSDHIGESKRFGKAVKGIDRSLNSKYWIDETHLYCKHGRKVFDHEHYAVRELMHILKNNKKCGGVTSMTLAYVGGSGVDVTADNGIVTDNGDGTYTIVPKTSRRREGSGKGSRGSNGSSSSKLSTNIGIYVAGKLQAQIHTSCSKPIATGDVYGDFTIEELETLPARGNRRDRVSEEALTCAESAIEKMVRVDRILAEISILEAEETGVPGNQKRFDREIAKAYKELERGDADRDVGKFDKAIKHYKKAWEYACRALDPNGRGSKGSRGSKGDD